MSKPFGNLWHMLILLVSGLGGAMMGALYNSPWFMILGITCVFIAIALFMNEVRKL